jgi:hypothetical protein
MAVVTGATAITIVILMEAEAPKAMAVVSGVTIALDTHCLPASYAQHGRLDSTKLHGGDMDIRPGSDNYSAGCGGNYLNGDGRGHGDVSGCGYGLDDFSIYGYGHAYDYDYGDKHYGYAAAVLPPAFVATGDDFDAIILNTMKEIWY